MKMKPLFIIKIIIDLAMMIVFLFLMSYYMLPDLTHELLGTVLFGLFLLHNILNWKWYKNLFHGKYSFMRIIRTVINFLLILSIFGCILSSLYISGHVFNFVGLPANRFGRAIHLLSTAWAFVLSGVHLGLHWQMFVGILNKKTRFNEKMDLIIKWVLRIVVILFSIYGLIVFFEKKLYEELFLLTEFKFFSDGTLFEYLFDYFSIYVLFVLTAYYLSKLYLKISIKRKNNKKIDVENGI